MRPRRLAPLLLAIAGCALRPAGEDEDRDRIEAAGRAAGGTVLTALPVARGLDLDALGTLRSLPRWAAWLLGALLVLLWWWF